MDHSEMPFRREPTSNVSFREIVGECVRLIAKLPVAVTTHTCLKPPRVSDVK